MNHELLGWIAKGVPILALLAACLTILGRNPPPRLIRWLAWSVVPVLLLKCYMPSEHYLCDFRAFYYAGREVIASRDPYLMQDGPARVAYLNPPTFQPFAILMSILPYRWMGALWVGLNIAAMLGLVELSRRVLNLQGGISGRSIPPQATAGLMAAVALSTASRFGLEVGQLGAVMALLLLGALGAQATGRPVLAGLLLASATTKPQTLLPFLILFLRRSDVATWATLAVSALLMVITTTPPHDWVARFGSWQASVRNSFEPGKINNLLNSGGSLNLISPSQILYGLGMRDLGQIWVYQSLLIIVLGLALMYEVAWRGRSTRQAASALVACYSMLFMYHRPYDAVLLALPLVYAATEASRSRGPVRALLVTSAMAILVAMNTYNSIQVTLLDRSSRLEPAGWLIRALVVPYPTYALMIAFLALWFAIRLQEPAGIEDQLDGRTPPAARNL
jgi:hypothetical protein